jgi:hypothetical protein
MMSRSVPTPDEERFVGKLYKLFPGCCGSGPFAMRFQYVIEMVQDLPLHSASLVTVTREVSGQESKGGPYI